MTNEERIKADAEAAIEILDDQLRPTSNDYGKRLNSLYYYKDGYIAGATALHDRAQVLVDALEWIKTYGPVNNLTVKFIDNALEKWKGKEAEPANDKCRCIQPNWNAFTGKCLTCGRP